MSSIEADLLLKLQRLHQEYQQLNDKIRDANNRRHYLRQAEEIDAAKCDEARLVVEMSRLMDRLRAVEGQLMQMRQRGQRRLQ